MNHIKLLFFATLRDRAGKRSMELDVAESLSVRELKDQLSKDYPSLRESLGSVLVAINHEFALDDALLPSNAEVALFPPVSGG